MQTQARCSSGDLELRDSLCSMFLQGQLLSCGESSAKLMRLLLEDDYPSGAQVDYYELSERLNTDPPLEGAVRAA